MLRSTEAAGGCEVSVKGSACVLFVEFYARDSVRKALVGKWRETVCQKALWAMFVY